MFTVLLNQYIHFNNKNKWIKELDNKDSLVNEWENPIHGIKIIRLKSPSYKYLYTISNPSCDLYISMKQIWRIYYKTAFCYKYLQVIPQENGLHLHYHYTRLYMASKLRPNCSICVNLWYFKYSHNSLNLVFGVRIKRKTTFWPIVNLFGVIDGRLLKKQFSKCANLLEKPEDELTEEWEPFGLIVLL